MARKVAKKSECKFPDFLADTCEVRSFLPVRSFVQRSHNKDTKMSFNLVDRVKSHINGDLIRQISRAVNGSDSQTQTAVDNAIPSLLNDFLSITVNKLGAESLFQSVNTQNDAILEHLDKQLIDDNHKSFANSGTYSLNLLLGARKIRALVDVVSGSSGLSHQSASSLLGIIIPIILSVIKQDLQGTGKLNTRELVSFLEQQHPSILEALPASFTTNLMSRHEIEGLTQESIGTTPKIEGVRERRRVRRTKRKSSLLIKWLLFLLLLLFLYFIFQVFFKPKNEPMTLPEVVQSTTQPSEVNKKILTTAEGGPLNKLKLILNAVTEALSNITDIESAKTGLVELELYATELDSLNLQMQGLSEDAKSEATRLVNSTIPEMEIFYDQIKTIPGGQTMIEPVIDRLIKKLVDMFI